MRQRAAVDDRPEISLRRATLPASRLASTDSESSKLNQSSINLVDSRLMIVLNVFVVVIALLSIDRTLWRSSGHAHNNRRNGGSAKDQTNQVSKDQMADNNVSARCVNALEPIW